MWVRGLKLKSATFSGRLQESHPMWVRGLKHHLPLGNTNQPPVAPYVGAWIETGGEK